jgi:hypothetical protein
LLIGAADGRVQDQPGLSGWITSAEEESENDYRQRQAQ